MESKKEETSAQPERWYRGVKVNPEQAKPVDIRGLNKVELLKALWENRQPASFFGYHPQIEVPKWDEDLANKCCAAGYIDYFQGRCIKTNLVGDWADPVMYDRDLKSGCYTFAQVTASLRKASEFSKGVLI